MGLSGCITHVIGYIGYIALFGIGICRFCVWVELPVQRRLCPIFVRNVGSPEIHECFRGLTVVNGPPGLGCHNKAPEYGLKDEFRVVDEYALFWV